MPTTATTDLLKPIPPLDNPVRVVDLVTNLTGQSREHVIETFQVESRAIGTAVGQACREHGIDPYVYNSRMEQFYQDTDAFLYETTVWNASPLKQEIRKWAGQFLLTRLGEGARVLTFGDGLGFDSAFLARLGFSVDYFEVSRQCITFASSVFADNRVDVSVVSDDRKLADETYDALLCLDVLEHVPDPPALVQRFSRWLKPGGYLVASAPFFFVCPTRPTHLRSNLKYSGEWKRLYGSSGFVPVDGRVFWDPLALRLSGERSSGSTWMSRLRVDVGRFILRGGRWAPGLYSQIADYIARPDKTWMNSAR